MSLRLQQVEALLNGNAATLVGQVAVVLYELTDHLHGRLGALLSSRASAPRSPGPGDGHVHAAQIAQKAYLAPVYCFPGEDEMEALALNALAVLRGKREAKEYE